MVSISIQIITLDFIMKNSVLVRLMMDSYNSRAQETEAGKSQVPGHLGLSRKILPQKVNKNTILNYSFVRLEYSGVFLSLV